MPKMVQLHHVRDDLSRKLMARAASEGMALSDYLLNEIRNIDERPTISVLCDRLAKHEHVESKIPPANAVRDQRGPI